MSLDVDQVDGAYLAFLDSKRRYGMEHTHDASCRTWQGQNWAGACDCTLPEPMHLGPEEEA